VKFSFKYFNASLFFFFFILSNQILKAGWSEPERLKAEFFNSQIKDPYIITLRNYSRKPSFILPKNRKTKIRKHFVSSTHFKDGKIPYLLGEIKDDPIARPLAVFIPGTFSKLFSPITKDFHLRLVRLGYRVISFENIFYHEAIKRGPLLTFLISMPKGKLILMRL